MLEHEQAQLMPMPREFDGYVETLCRVSTTCLVVVDGNRYSVPCEWVRQMVSARVYPTRVEIVGPSDSVAEANGAGRALHARLVNRGRTAYHWQHYTPLVQRKPGALRHGAPFADMPEALKKLQRQLMRREGGDRLMAHVLAVVPKAGLEAVVVAVELLLESAGSIVPSAEHVINVLSRLTLNPSAHAMQRAMSQVVVPAELVAMAELPTADTARYDGLLATRDRHDAQGADHA